MGPGFDPWTAGAALTALLTVGWGILLLRKVRRNLHDRLLIGLVGLVASYLGLHLAVEPRGWAWAINLVGVVACLAAMAMLGNLARRHQQHQMALRLAEARERAYATLPVSVSALVRTTQTFDLSRSVLDAAPMAMFVISLDGSVNFWNSAAERTLGWSRQEVLGHRMPNLVMSPASPEATGIRLMRKDGVPVSAPVQSVPMRDPQGTVNGILTIISPLPLQRA